VRQSIFCGAFVSVLSNAVLVWNTTVIMKIITELRALGETILDEDLTRISPRCTATSSPTKPIISRVLSRAMTLRTIR
jgi:hypothetical protein